jgi:hypothetical protein
VGPILATFDFEDWKYNFTWYCVWQEAIPGWRAEFPDAAASPSVERS